MILHHIQHSQHDNGFSLCLRYKSAEDNLYFSGDGVTILLNKALVSRIAAPTIYVRHDDATALNLAPRIKQIPLNIQLIDDAEFVALTLSHSKIISW